jgi:hypothetical protein
MCGSLKRGCSLTLTCPKTFAWHYVNIFDKYVHKNNISVSVKHLSVNANDYTYLGFTQHIYGYEHLQAQLVDIFLKIRKTLNENLKKKPPPKCTTLIKFSKPQN